MFYLQSPVGNRTVIHATQKGRAGFDALRHWKASWFASGTAALSAAVKTAVVARKIEHPEVLLPAYGCPDLVAAIRHAGAKPYFVDLSPDSFRMNSLTVAEVIDSRPSVVALIGVDLFGCPENWTELYALCRANDIVAIRDCAQSLQSREKIDRELDADFLVYSFGRGKPLYLQGGGAMLRRSDAPNELAAAQVEIEAPLEIRDGWYSRAKNELYNALLEPHLYAVMARLLGKRLGVTRYEPLEKIERAPLEFAELANPALEGFWRNHRSRQNELMAMLSAIKSQLAGLVKVAPNYPGPKQILLRLPLLLRDRSMRDELQAAMLNAGISATTMYGQPLPFINGVGCEQGMRSFPMAEDIAGRLLTLPLHERITDRDLMAMKNGLLNMRTRY